MPNVMMTTTDGSSNTCDSLLEYLRLRNSRISGAVFTYSFKAGMRREGRVFCPVLVSSELRAIGNRNRDVTGDYELLAVL